MNDTYEHESIWLNLFEQMKHRYYSVVGREPNKHIVAHWERLSQQQFRELNEHFRQVQLHTSAIDLSQRKHV